MTNQHVLIHQCTIINFEQDKSSENKTENYNERISPHSEPERSWWWFRLSPVKRLYFMNAMHRRRSWFLIIRKSPIRIDQWPSPCVHLCTCVTFIQLGIVWFEILDNSANSIRNYFFEQKFNSFIIKRYYSFSVRSKCDIQLN